MGDEKKTELSVLTYNTLGVPFFAKDITKRYLKAAQLINNSSFDVICLQELFTYYHFFLFQRKLTNYPHYSMQKNPFGPKGGLVIFSKLPLSRPDFFTYSYPQGAAIPLYTKIAQNGMLSSAIESLGIRIATTHFTSDVVHDLSPKDKYYALIRNQSQEAAEVVNRYTKNEMPLILTGDFNIAKDSVLYREFIQKADLSDVFYNSSESTYFPDRIPYFYVANASARIDFIFVSPKTNFKSKVKEHLFIKQISLANGKKSYLSDHIALHCILTVNK